MFEISETKAFMDSVHGYITIPKCFVEHLIDTEYFQRLRNIDQTGMRILYPDGKHDRFCHSLGVFYLGSKAVDALLNNFSHDNYWNISSDRDGILFWAKNKILFLIACLLHDIGHAPFSHSLESEIHTNSGGDRFRERLAKKINEGERSQASDTEAIEISSAEITGVPHEQVGALLILEHLRENVERVFDALIADSYPRVSERGILYAEYYSYNPVINKNELDADLCFIARMILGLKYKEYTPEKQIRNCFIELLNGSNFDVDKLDYIIRDTKMSGISNIAIDVERLLKSISIVTKTVYSDADVEINQEKSSSPIVHSISNKDGNGKVKVYGSYKGTFMFQIGAKVKILKGGKFVSLKGTKGDAKISLLNKYAEFCKDAAVTKDGTPLMPEEGSITLSRSNNNVPFFCEVRNAEVMNEDGFGFEVRDGSTIELTVNGACDVEIEGGWFSKTSVLFFDTFSFKGRVNKLVVLGNLITEEIPNTTCYNAFSIGFKKQAINIIANVIEARDYLYLWCYAHHKIIYYANFLVPTIADSLVGKKKQHSEGFGAWELCYEDILNLDDAYIWTAVKAMKHSVDEPLKSMCKELLSRKYKKSMWKSLAEYDLIFESFEDEQKRSIRNFFAQNVQSELPKVGIREYSAGFVPERFLAILRQMNKELEEIKSIVFVEASYRQKITDMHSTLVLIGDNVTPMDRIPLLKDKEKIMQRSTNHYFYLYYDTQSEKGLSAKGQRLLKEAIKKVFKDNINSLDLDSMERSIGKVAIASE